MNRPLHTLTNDELRVAEKAARRACNWFGQYAHLMPSGARLLTLYHLERIQDEQRDRHEASQEQERYG